MSTINSVNEQKLAGFIEWLETGEGVAVAAENTQAAVAKQLVAGRASVINHAPGVSAPKSTAQALSM